MKKQNKIITSVIIGMIAIAAIIFGVLQLVGGNLDVIGQTSISSFAKVLAAVPAQVSADEMNGGWSLAAPDGSIRFIWSQDYSTSQVHDAMVELSAEPFIAAGLDVDKLPDNYSVYEEMLMVGTKLGNDKLTYTGEVTPLAAYEQMVSKYRSSINYHISLDHFGVKLGDGNMFEWAKDLAKNTVSGSDQDKDIVFVLNPEPLIAAGVEPQKVDGWVYAQVPVEENGQTVQVYKFLKPFNIG
ncbi:MAG TPA: hypothetical protein DCM45_07945 [Clostridiales bacterium]|nr:hypothetical protein [Clostridiales bacterium]